VKQNIEILGEPTVIKKNEKCNIAEITGKNIMKIVFIGVAIDRENGNPNGAESIVIAYKKDNSEEVGYMDLGPGWGACHIGFGDISKEDIRFYHGEAEKFIIPQVK